MEAREVHNVAAEKAQKRRLFRQRRSDLSEAEREAQSLAICDRLRQLVAARGAGTVSAFWPLASEVDVRPVIREWAATGVSVALPVVVRSRADSPGLVHRRFGGEHRLRAGSFGVMEPLAEAPEIAPEAIDLAIVPALAVDARGVRLGYGGGYYDRFLAETGAERVAVVFASGAVKHLPAEPHDQRMDLLITPEASMAMPRNPSGRTA